MLSTTVIVLENLIEILVNLMRVYDFQIALECDMALLLGIMCSNTLVAVIVCSSSLSMNVVMY